MIVQDSVVGFHSSAECTAPAWSLNPGPLVPPVTSTLPSARSVALVWRRANAMPGTVRQAGEAWLRSITSADAVGGSPPPAYRILPGAYITADPSLRSATLRGQTVVQWPVPETSRYWVVDGKP